MKTIGLSSLLFAIILSGCGIAPSQDSGTLGENAATSSSKYRLQISYGFVSIAYDFIDGWNRHKDFDSIDAAKAFAASFCKENLGPLNSEFPTEIENWQTLDTLENSDVSKINDYRKIFQPYYAKITKVDPTGSTQCLFDGEAVLTTTVDYKTTVVPPKHPRGQETSTREAHYYRDFSGMRWTACN